MGEHRDEIVLDLVELDHGVAPRRQLPVELDVPRRHREVLTEQPDRKDVRGAERRVAAHVEDVRGAAARAGHPHRGTVLVLVEHAHVAA